MIARSLLDGRGIEHMSVCVDCMLDSRDASEKESSLKTTISRILTPFI
jgi:hypothetical protein